MNVVSNPELLKGTLEKVLNCRQICRPRVGLGPQKSVGCSQVWESVSTSKSSEKAQELLRPFVLPPTSLENVLL